MADRVDIDHEIDGQCRTSPRALARDRALAKLALRQHGVVARRQLTNLGFGKGAIDHRVANGRLHVIHRGVYVVGLPRLTWHGRSLAAVLAYGPGAVLSHRSAAAVWDLASGGGSRVDVTVLARGARGKAGIALHRVRALHPDDCTVREGIPVTALARTLLDLADVMPPRRVGLAFERAERLGVLDMRALEATNERTRGRRGRPVLRRLLAEAGEPPDTRSELERRFVEFCDNAKLPRPALNVWAGEYEVDALWQRQRFIVELDSYAFHRSRTAFEKDRARDADLQLAGYRVLRVTDRRLRRDPAGVAAAVRSLLGP